MVRKKIILIVLICTSIIAPYYVSANTVVATQVSHTPDIKILLNQMVQLKAQLVSLQQGHQNVGSKALKATKQSTYRNKNGFGFDYQFSEPLKVSEEKTSDSIIVRFKTKDNKTVFSASVANDKVASMIGNMLGALYQKNGLTNPNTGVTYSFERPTSVNGISLVNKPFVFFTKNVVGNSFGMIVLDDIVKDGWKKQTGAFVLEVHWRDQSIFPYTKAELSDIDKTEFAYFKTRKEAEVFLSTIIQTMKINDKKILKYLY